MRNIKGVDWEERGRVKETEGDREGKGGGGLGRGLERAEATLRPYSYSSLHLT